MNTLLIRNEGRLHMRLIKLSKKHLSLPNNELRRIYNISDEEDFMVLEGDVYNISIINGANVSLNIYNTKKYK